MELTLLSGAASRVRAWRICSADSAGGRPRREAGGELGPFGGAAGQLVGVHPDTAGVGQCSGLSVEVLAGGGHPGVADERAGRRGRFGGERVVRVAGAVRRD